MKTVNFAILFLILTLNANAGWKALHKLDYYGPTAYNLKEGVSYIEFRKHYSQTVYSVNIDGSSSVSSEFSIYRDTPYNKNIFSNFPIVKKYAIKKGGRAALGASSSWYYNAFMQDETRKLWRLENKQDVIDMIKPIDTPAEIRLILWLNSKIYSANNDQYKKSGNGYIIKSHYFIYDDREAEGCGEYAYQYRVSRSGKLTKKRLSKKRVKECGTSD